MLYFIACRFKVTKDAPYVCGFAVCTDPDTPETFIYPDGRPLLSAEIWDYTLQHTMPWCGLEIQEEAKIK